MLSCIFIQRYHSLSSYYALHKNYLFLQIFPPLNLLGFVTDSINQVKDHMEIRLLSKYMNDFFSFNVNACFNPISQ